MLFPIKPIASNDKILSVCGKILYNDRRRRIDLKKPVRDLFEQTPDPFYIMELCLNEKKLHERINELSKMNITPVILYFGCKENEMSRMRKFSDRPK